MRYRFIGDTVLTVPFLRALRQAYPNSEIHLLAGPNSGEILTHCPYIDKLLIYDTTRKHAYENVGRTGEPTKSMWHYARQFRHNRYQMAFVLKRSLSSALLAWMSWIPERIGFDTEGRRYLLTKAFAYDSNKPEADCFLDALRAMDIPVSNTYLEAWWSPLDEKRAKDRLAIARDQCPQLTQKPIHAALHGTTSNAAKALPPHFLMAYCQSVLESTPVLFHAFGTHQDTETYEQVKRSLPNHLRQRIAIHCGQTSLLESQAMLAQCHFIAGVDSGTLHMAAAAQTPVIGYIQPELVEKWSPVPLLNGPDHHIFTQPDVDGFVQATHTLLAYPSNAGYVSS